ncbi:hypothetical protein RhiLY_13336 [Ceratobasidium sp. AG-Ba]|nr:hypothetical protein RhiLY_13336 [Ceratobasidium sp. AG-Ba]
MAEFSELYATADFCLIPMGTNDPSVGPQIAERVLEKSGLTYKLHMPHTTTVDTEQI